MPAPQNCSQEAQVAAVEEADVVDPVAEHRDALDAEAEREAGIDSRSRSRRDANTAGSTIPAPRISSQPVPLQTRQPSAPTEPRPPQITQPMSTSALGSVKGKKLGRKRTADSRAEQLAQERRQHALQVRRT